MLRVLGLVALLAAIAPASLTAQTYPYWTATGQRVQVACAGHNYPSIVQLPWVEARMQNDLWLELRLEWEWQKASRRAAAMLFSATPTSGVFFPQLSNCTTATIHIPPCGCPFYVLPDVVLAIDSSSLINITLPWSAGVLGTQIQVHMQAFLTYDVHNEPTAPQWIGFVFSDGLDLTLTLTP